MIPFNKAPITGKEVEYIKAAIESGKLCGDGPYTKKVEALIEKKFGTNLALLTPSCTAALEMAAILVDIKAGDEVIMPSYTFVSTANAFVLRGAKVVFIDIRPDTMNINESLIEAAITPKTKAIVPVHYAGVACEMATIMSIAEKHNLWVIEDAAQGVMSSYNDKALGTIGHIGCYSFHETKNYTAGGEGGALLVNHPSLVRRAEVIREKGTDRSLFLKGQVDKYTWRDIGSSFLPSEIQAAYLLAQFESAEEINTKRREIWDRYYSILDVYKDSIERPTVPDNCVHNAHMFYLKFKSMEMRTRFIKLMKENGVACVFHYIPLHSSFAGEKFGRFNGSDSYTTQESQKLVRLPLFYNMSNKELDTVISTLQSTLEVLLSEG